MGTAYRPAEAWAARRPRWSEGGGLQDRGELLLGVRAAGLEVVESEFRLEAQQHGLTVAGAGLGFFASGVNAVTNASPHIDFIVEVDGKKYVSETVASGAAGRAVGAVRGLAHSTGGGCDSDGWIKRGVGEADQCARLAEPCIRGLEILVVRGHLWLKRIQFRIAEDLPPFAAGDRIRGLGHLPVGVLLIGVRVCFFIPRRHGDRWLHVLRADHATAEGEYSSTG